MNLEIFDNNEILIKNISDKFIFLLNKIITEKGKAYIALSGGNTPKKLYEYLYTNYKYWKNWHKIHFFWGDERCVPADSPESNYGICNTKLLSKVEIPKENIYPIEGTVTPEISAEKYSELIKKHLPEKNLLPRFDLVILGMGADGHTASIFPPQIEFIESDKICEAATHPETKQKRISLTGKVINNADNIWFLLSGKNKAEKLKSILNKEPKSKNYPAAHIAPTDGNLIWFADKNATHLLQ